MMMKGVANIDNTMLARIGFSKAGGTSAFFCASVSNTKPNSPACARYSPVRSETPVLAPSARDSPVTTTALKKIGTINSSKTSGQRSKTKRQSSSMPMLIKNRPSNTSWKGRISVSTWCLNSVSDISMPAMKAPSAKLKPANSVNQAKPRVMKSRLSTNNSSLLRRATRVNHQRITWRPPTSNTVISTLAFRAAMPSACTKCSPDAPSAGISTRSGTTAKSWNSKIPITRLPCSDSISIRSVISLTTMAVLLIANALDSAKEVCQLISHN